ncbi:CTD kinase subunit beta [Podospora fimiseda]|uniref:RNA polymerase II holoenzyme cyclin-like subunit n=1 Tax=Podospora fimiseda TaxID=252190 RepID=A0AAN7GWM8_9PEZI|nr:CTD kinase subunit beta [Podospora fimiseda]
MLNTIFMAPPATKAPAPATNGQIPEDDANKFGPPSGLSSIRTQYIPEQTIRQHLKNIGYDVAREDIYRIKGIQLIDNVREALQLPIKTFDSASVYYHKFRMRFPSSEYNYEDVALACLFAACKAEDTIKKSRDILCTAHNIRSPHDQRTPDDVRFSDPSRFTIGLERHILETIGFDFRVQYPQKLLIKMVKRLFPPNDQTNPNEARRFLRTAYDMSIDLHKTHAPLKQTTFTMVLAILELTARLTDSRLRSITRLEQNAAAYVDRQCIIETMLDLMDLYQEFTKSTKIGASFELQKLMSVKIDINALMSEGGYQRYHGWCDKCTTDLADTRTATPGSATSPATATSASTKRKREEAGGGTLRFVFDVEAARRERDLVSEYHNDEYEEYEVEVDETIPEADPRQNNTHNNNNRNNHHGPRSHYNNDWGYHRGGNRHAPHRRRGHGGY